MNTLSLLRSRRGLRKVALVATVVALRLAMGQGTAQALPHFPRDIATDLQSDTEPACSICHLGGKIGAITTVTPFALALKSRGFDGETPSLATALTRLEGDQTDTDGDGVTDVEELRAGTDPNSAVPLAPSADPSFGCSVARTASTAGRASWGGAGVLMAAALLLTRRRRSSS